MTALEEYENKQAPKLVIERGMQRQWRNL